MHMTRTEDHHNSTEQIEGYLATAKGILDRSELTFEERVAALPTVLSLVSNKQVFYEQAPSIGGLALPPNHG